MNEALIKRNSLLGAKVVEALNKRHFEAYYVENKSEALKKALELIPSSHSVSWGGSVTIDEIGLKDELKKRGNILIDRNSANSPEEREEIMRKALLCDTFLMSSNAITEDGELYNIDGHANRVAALCFGPKYVVIVAGMNKIVKDMDAAYSKVRNYTAPVNAQRFNLDTPCCKTGACFNCNSIQSICAQMVETRFCRPQGRIKVILVGEELGF
ncbi:MAG: lactate utilization protein [Spirochaetales bacterium]|nr:lactate utilization protein [Spirochaetales bacterium]